MLRQKGAPVTEFDGALATFAADMVETMRAAKGIGLAAQQVGRAMQFFVIEIKAPEDGHVEFAFTLDGREAPLELLMPLAVANAQVEILPDEEWLYSEGCLSFPKLNGEVARRERVRMTYQDLSGAGHEIVCNGLFARCIQHEHDHCQGVLFIDRMEKPDLLKIQARVKQLKRETLRALKEREAR